MSLFISAFASGSRFCALVLGLYLIHIASQGQNTYELIKSFGDPTRMGNVPSSKLTLGLDGYLYGTTRGREVAPSDPYQKFHDGTIYRVLPDGSVYEVVYRFDRTEGLAKPQGHLLQASDGYFYGVTEVGSASGRGVVYRFDPVSRTIMVLKQLDGVDDQALIPYAGLIEASDGMLYGTARGSNAQPSIVYRLARDGSNYSVIHVLPKDGEFDSFCEAPLLEGSDGFLYGACRVGGRNNTGSVFRLAKDGSNYTLIWSFGNATGTPAFPAGGLVEASDGSFYGLLGSSVNSPTQTGGAIYSIQRSGTGFRILRTFTMADRASSPIGELLQGTDGRLYGALRRGRQETLGGFFAFNLDGSALSIWPNDSITEFPSTGLTQTLDGRLHAVFVSVEGAYNGSSLGSLATNWADFDSYLRFSPSGYETPTPAELLEGPGGWLYSLNTGNALEPPVFYRIKKDGSELTPLNRTDFVESNPLFLRRGLVAGDGGFIYATAIDRQDPGTEGIVRLSDQGQVLGWVKKFGAGAGNPSELSGIHLSEDGFIYGLSASGGTDNLGTIYRVARDGSGFTILRHFKVESSSLGAAPHHGLIETPEGKLAGVISIGIFQMGKDGEGYSYTPLPAEYGGISGNLMADDEGMIYGITRETVFNPASILFRFDAARGEFTVLRVFIDDLGTKFSLSHPLAMKDGFIYGLTQNGSRPGTGYLFRIKGTGEDFEILHQRPDDRPENTLSGYDPLKGLLLGSDGAFYGSYSAGGEFGFGALFRYGPPPSPRLVATNQAGETMLNGAELDLGPYDTIGATISRSLRLSNEGGQPLVLSQLALFPPESEFRVVPPPSLSLDPGQAVQLGVDFRVFTTGLNTGVLRWYTNDPESVEFVVNLRATVEAPIFRIFDGSGEEASEIVIPEGSEEVEEIDLGEDRRGSPLGRQFRVSNAGSRDLVILESPIIGEHRIATPLPVSIPPGGSALVRIERDTSVLGPRRSRTIISTNDHLQRVRELRFVSTVVDPEIAVHQGPTTASPELTSGQAGVVDFGRNIQGTAGVKIVTVSNTGTAPLLVSSISVPAGYELATSTVLPTTMAPGTSNPWPIRLISPQPGFHAGAVTIASDDVDEPAFTFQVRGEVYIPAPEATWLELPNGALTTLNRQTGLREQRWRLSNDTTATVPAYRLLISGLPGGVALANAGDSLADGTFVVLVRQPLSPFSFHDLVLELSSNDRRPLAAVPKISVEVVLDPPDDTAADEPRTFAIEKMTWLPDASGLLLEFHSEPGRRYRIQYSQDGVNWKNSADSIQGAGTRTQWMDRGPPATTSPPTSSLSRFYRVALLAP